MFTLTAYWILCTIAHSAQGETESKQTEEDSISYDGAQVWKVELRKPEDMMLILDLMKKQELSIWQLTPNQAMFLVEMDDKLNVHRQLSAKGLSHTVLIMDVQRQVDDQKMEPDPWDDNALRRGHRMNWRKYPTVEVLNEYMTYLAKNYPSVCKQKIIGKSVENRSIMMLEVSNGNPQNKGIMLVSGLHAREWIVITSVLYILNEIVTKFDNQPDYIRNKNWYLIPLLNPDGYRYSYKHDRLWRKNRRINHEIHCTGVDLNRNFDIDWDDLNLIERNPCSEIYRGPHPFSEPETIALRKTFENLKRRVIALIDFHSYGQMILYPWGAKSYPSKDDHLLNAAAKEMRAEILKSNRREYSYGRIYHEIYPTSGNLVDWAYSLGIHYSYGIEGRDKGEHGFLIRSMYIQEAGEELLTAVTSLARVIPTKVNKGERRYPWF